MNRSHLFLISICLMWLLPVFASAQDCEERGHLRICSAHADDGTRIYRVTAHANASYQEILDFANEGIADARQHITPSQFDDANDPYVIYYCPGTSLCGGDGICRNGVSAFVNGDSVPRHYDTACDGSGIRASRGLVAGVTYSVPAHRGLTPSEIVTDAHATLAALEHPTIADIRTAAETAGRAGQDLEHPPSTLGLADVLNGIASATNRLDAAPVAPAVVSTPVVHETVAPAPVHETVSATAVTDNSLRWPWWVTIVACLIGMIVTFFMGRAVGRSQNKALQDFFQEQAKHALARTRIGTLEESLRLRYGEITDLEAKLKEAASAKRAKDNSPSPLQLLEQKLAGIWNEVKKGALKSQKDIDRLLMLVANIPDDLAKDALVLLVNGSQMQLQLQAANGAFEERIERARRTAKDEGREEARTALQAEFSREREALAGKAGEASEQLTRANERVGHLEQELNELKVPAPQASGVSHGVIEAVNDRLEALFRDFFSDVLKRDEQRPSRRIVDAERVKARFTKMIEIPYSNGSNGSSRRKRDRAPETSELRTVHELKALELTDFLRGGFEAFDGLRRYVQGALGLGPLDLTPAPGAIPVPARSAEAAELLASDASSAPGQDDLLEHPDDTETSEMERDELETQHTSILQNPLLAAPSRPARDDEATKVVGRRNTDIGIGGEALKPVSPIAVPAPDEAEAPAETREDEGEAQA